MLVGIQNVVVPLARAHGKGGQPRGHKARHKALVARVDKDHVGFECRKDLDVDVGSLKDVRVGFGNFRIDLAQKPLFGRFKACWMHRNEFAASSEIHAGHRGVGKDVGHGHALDFVGHVHGAVEVVRDGTGRNLRGGNKRGKRNKSGKATGRHRKSGAAGGRTAVGKIQTKKLYARPDAGKEKPAQLPGGRRGRSGSVPLSGITCR